MDAQVVLERCAGLIARAEELPADEPLRRAEPARRAAEEAARCLAALDEADRTDPEIGGLLHLRRANALRLAGHAFDDEARASYEAALAVSPDRAAWWYDYGLLHKWRGRWEEALTASRRARELGGDNRPLLWNVAIAATALGRGEEAADAWRTLGIPARLNEAGMPVVDGLEPAQLRVPSRGTGHDDGGALPDRGATFELVWVAPLSPVHGVVQTPTFRDAPVDWGDVVLWDGAPVDVAEIDGRPVPRFPLLEILARGDERRLRFVGLQQAAGEVERLSGELPEGCLVFVQAERIEHVCVRCASGEVLTKHEHTAPAEHRIVYGKIIVPGAVELAQVRDVIATAMRSRGTFQLAIPQLHELLGDTKRAGQEHQAWRGIERVAIRKGLKEA